MKLPPGKEQLAELSLVQVVGQLLIADTQSHAVRFVGQGALGNHAVGGALHQKRHDRGRDVTAELLAPDHAGPLRNLLQAYVFRTNLGDNAGGGDAAAEVVAE